MRAATLVHLLVVLLFFLAIFIKKVYWFKIDGETLKKLKDKLSPAGLEALGSVMDREFLEGKLRKELAKLRFKEKEIKLILENASKEEKINYSTPYLAPYIILFISWAFLSTYFSVCLRPSVEELVRLTDYMMLTWITAGFIDKRSSPYMILVILFSSLIVALAGILFLLLPGVDDFRAYSTFYQSDAFAGYLLLTIPLLICLSCGKFSFWPRVFYMVLGVLFTSCLYLAQSRGAWLCFIVILAVIFIGMRKKGLLVAVFKIFFFLIFSYAFVHFLPSGGDVQAVEQVFERATEVGNLEHSSLARLQFWAGAVKIAWDYPVTGIGLGNFGRLYPRFQQEVYYFSHYTHNYYAQIAAEMGIVGFIALMTLIFAILFIGVKLIFKGDTWAKTSENQIFEKKLKSEKTSIIVRAAIYISQFLEDLSYNNQYIVSLGLFCSILASMMHSFIDVDWNFPAIPQLL